MATDRSGPLFTALVELQDRLRRQPINDRYTRALTKALREQAIEHAIDLIRRGCSRVDRYFRISRKDVINALMTFGPHEEDLISLTGAVISARSDDALLHPPPIISDYVRCAHYAGLAHAALAAFGSLNDALHSVGPGHALTPDERAELVRFVNERFCIDFSSKLDIEPDTVREPGVPAAQR